MNTTELTELVRQRGGYDSAETTAPVVEAVLTVLGSRTMDGEAANLAAQLPGDFGRFITSGSEKAEEFGADEFIKKVQERLNISETQAQLATHAVLSAMTEAVTPGEQVSFMNALPNDLSSYARWN